MARRSNAKGSGGNRSSGSIQGSSNSSKSSTVEIFTATFCPHCQDAKVYMQMNKIKFKEHNLERSKDAEKKFLGLGGKKIPLLIVKGKILRSWNQAAFEKAYKG